MVEFPPSERGAEADKEDECPQPGSAIWTDYEMQADGEFKRAYQIRQEIH